VLFRSKLRKRIDQTFYDMYINPNSCFPQFLQENPFKQEYGQSVSGSQEQEQEQEQGNFLVRNNFHLPFKKMIRMIIPDRPNIRWKCDFSDASTIQQIVQNAIAASLSSQVKPMIEQEVQNLLTQSSGSDLGYSQQGGENGNNITSEKLTTYTTTDTTNLNDYLNLLKQKPFTLNIDNSLALYELIREIEVDLSLDVQNGIIGKKTSDTYVCNGNLKDRIFRVALSHSISGIDLIFHPNNESIHIRLPSDQFSANFLYQGTIDIMGYHSFCPESASPKESKSIYKVIETPYGNIGYRRTFGISNDVSPDDTIYIDFFVKVKNRENPLHFIYSIHPKFTYSGVRIYSPRGPRAKIEIKDGNANLFSEEFYFEPDKVFPNPKNTVLSSAGWKKIEEYLNRSLYAIIMTPYRSLTELEKELTDKDTKYWVQEFLFKPYFPIYFSMLLRNAGYSFPENLIPSDFNNRELSSLVPDCGKNIDPNKTYDIFYFYNEEPDPDVRYPPSDDNDVGPAISEYYNNYYYKGYLPVYKIIKDISESYWNNWKHVTCYVRGYEQYLFIVLQNNPKIEKLEFPFASLTYAYPTDFDFTNTKFSEAIRLFGHFEYGNCGKRKYSNSIEMSPPEINLPPKVKFFPVPIIPSVFFPDINKNLVHSRSFCVPDDSPLAQRLKVLAQWNALGKDEQTFENWLKQLNPNVDLQKLKTKKEFFGSVKYKPKGTSHSTSFYIKRNYYLSISSY
jgi:hypothetical protein